MHGVVLALSRKGAQIPLAIFSFVAALAILLTAALAPNEIDRPIAIAISVLLVLNGCARLVFWRHAKRPG
jgi:hypothetical protein